MATTAAKLRAVVEADTSEASAKLHGFGRQVSETRATTNAEIGGIAESFGALGQTLGALGVGISFAQIAKGTIELGNLGQQVLRQREYFNVWSGSLNDATKNLEAMRVAVGGAATESEMMVAANKFMSMGLAKNSEELAKLSRMAVMLGGDTRTAGQAMEEFALLLANQSILRLDTFGISGARVRARIEELQAADKDLSREQAFLNAVMEEGTAKLEKLEAAGIKTTTQVGNLTTAWGIFRETAGKALAPAVGKVETELADALSAFTFMFEISADDKALQAANAQLQAAEEGLRRANQEGQYLGRSTQVWKDEVDRAKAAVDEANLAILSTNHLIETASDETKDWVDRLRDAAQAADAVATAAAAKAASIQDAARDAILLMERAEARTAIQAALAADAKAAAEAEAAAKAAARANQRIADDYTRRMQDAVRKVASEYQSAMTAAQNASIGLLDLRPGQGGGPNAPGANGPFEDIYRLQAFIQSGTWGETAEKYGLDMAGAQDVVRKFQTGMWDASVMALVDKNALTAQIKDAQVAKTMMDAVAADLARESGADPKLIKAMLGLPSAQGAAGVPGMTDLSAQVAPLVDGILGAWGDQIGKRYSDFKEIGGRGWEGLRDGMLERARADDSFRGMVEAWAIAAVGRGAPAAGAGVGAQLAGVGEP